MQAMQTEIRQPRSRRRVPVTWLPRVFFRARVRDMRLLQPVLHAATSPMFARVGSFIVAGCCPILALVLFGCSSPAVRRQRLVAKPNMTFSDSAAFTYNAPRLLPQLARGFGSAGASQNSGCTSCR